MNYTTTLLHNITQQQRLAERRAVANRCCFALLLFLLGFTVACTHECSGTEGNIVPEDCSEDKIKRESGG